MKKNKLPVHYTSAEETEPVGPAVDSGDGGVQITLAKSVITPGSHKAIYLDEISSVPNVALSLSFFNGEAAQNVTPMARDFKLGTWLLASAIISVTSLYTICNPKWVPSFVAQTVKISKHMSVTDTAKAGAGTVAGAAGIHGVPTGRNSASAVQPPASLRDVDRSTIEMPKAAEAKTSKSKKDFMVPPPPPIPCVLPPAFSSFLIQPAQQHAAPQQSTAASGSTEATQSAALGVSDQELQAGEQELEAADQKLQAALRSSLSTVGEWTR